MNRKRTRKLTFIIPPPGMCNGIAEKTLRYSKVDQLVITKGVEGKREYVITHVFSGRAVVRVPKLAQAREAFQRLLLLTNWNQPANKLESDATLRDACREVAREVRNAIYTK